MHSGSSRAHKILYVDDEPANLAVFKYCFGSSFDVITAQTAEEALAVLGSGRVAVLLADQRMPGMGGAELCAVAFESFPDVVRIIVTAYADLNATVAAINRGQVSHYVFKPWEEEQLAEIIRAAIDRYDLTVRVRELQLRISRLTQQATAEYVAGKLLHEIANPLGALRSCLYLMKQRLAEVAPLGSVAWPHLHGEMTSLLSAGRDACVAADEIGERLARLRCARGSRPRTRAASCPNSAVENAVAIVGPAPRANARVVLQLGTVPLVAADSEQLSHILVNLLTNAMEALDPERPGGNQITVRTLVRGDRAVVEVEDTGVGIVPEILPRVFEPWFTTKRDDRPRGLGLAIVREEVEGFGGKVSVQSKAGRGTCFAVEIPLAPVSVSLTARSEAAAREPE